MAIRLTLPTEPYWLELPHGVRLRVAPICTRIWEAAKAEAVRECRALLDAVSEVEDHGGGVTGLSLDQAADLAALSQVVLVKGLAVRAVLGWEGVTDDEGAPLDVSPERVRRLMDFHAVADAFIALYTRDYHDRVTEGNASGPSPRGTSATGPTTADAAGMPLHLAPTAGRA